MSQPEVVVVQPDPPPKYEGPPQPERQPLTTVTTHQEVPRPQLGKNSGSKFRGVFQAILTYLQGDPSPRGLGWVDLDLGCSTVLLGQHRSCSTAQRTVEEPKSKSTQPSPRGDGSPCR